LIAVVWDSKMDGDEEATTTIITNAIAAPEGHLRLANAEEFIIGEVERNRFNTERAVEIYTVAIDNSVWAWTKGMTLGKLMYRDYQRSGLGKKFAIELTENFKKGSGVLPIEDQRPPRRFLRFLLGA
jgi:hypothetical protein